MSSYEDKTLVDQMVDMQTQLAFQEDTVQVLNDMVVQHQQDILGLQSQVDRLSHELKRALVQQDFMPADNTPPPHY